MPGLDNFIMPQAMVTDAATATPRYGKFVAEPWENGFGHTIGNALRRVLLSSMGGVAVSSLRIDGVAHEFDSIPHVVEDVTEIVLNLKKLHVRSDGEMPRTLELSVSKAGPVTAGDIKTDGVTDVLNPELVICTLDQDAPLHMEITIDEGRGYRPAEENKSEDQPIGIIPVDCLFSPVERVRYDVQACRVGQRLDYDRLELEVWTDGRIHPYDAVRNAAVLLRSHLEVFAAEDTSERPHVQATSAEEQELLEKLMMSVNDLELSVRAKNCLNTAQISLMGELVQKSEAEMLKFRNFGKKSLQEIKVKLVEMGLGLGMTLKDDMAAAVLQASGEPGKEE